ncbi:MAG: XRE family transcriptional regulator [Cyanobacteria bacterium RU_5_0]|nr:XRE family transcriptional regulator [Cyanobacteria bacterium RU_5_0]
MLNVGRATQTLRQVLKTYEISHDNLATTMGISRVKVDRWFYGIDPTAEEIAAMTRAIKQISPDAAIAFVQQYLGTILEDEEDQE